MNVVVDLGFLVDMTHSAKNRRKVEETFFSPKKIIILNFSYIMFTQYPHFHFKRRHYIYTYVYTYDAKEGKHVSSKTLDITCQRRLRWNMWALKVIVMINYYDRL